MSYRLFLLTGLGFLTLAFLATIGVWGYWQLTQSVSQPAAETTIEASESSTTGRESGIESRSGGGHDTLGKATETIVPADDSIVVPSDTISPAQRAVLETFGFNPEALRFTSDQLACAETTLGSQRYAEIVAGDTPGPLELAQLARCITP